MLDAAMPRKVEDGLLAENRRVEIAGVNQQFVVFGLGFRDNLAVGIDDQAAADQRKSVLDAGLGDGDDPGRILIGPGLNGKTIVKQPLSGPSSLFCELTDGVL